MLQTTLKAQAQTAAFKVEGDVVQSRTVTLRFAALVTFAVSLSCAPAVYAAAGNIDAGRLLVMRSCSSCHAGDAALTATDGAPPLSAVAKTNKERPAWIRGWLMDPHPPMPSIMLSRQQIDDITAYLSSLPSD